MINLDWRQQLSFNIRTCAETIREEAESSGDWSSFQRCCAYLVADLLGHRSLKSTAIYAQVVDTGRNAMMSRLDSSKYVVSWRS